jgi:outer membrane protein OmpA-like peptidoglycan-associated protein
MTGEVKTKEGDPVWGAQVELQNTKTKEKTLAVVDSTTGKFMVAVNISKKEDMVLTVKNKELGFTSSLVKTTDVSFTNPPKPVELITDSIKVGNSYVINNIYYNSNSAELMEESKNVLKTFADYLKEHPGMKIEIQGHTDNVGNASANQALSANRAFTVKALIESYGIEGSRITAKGFGSSKPITDNTTEAGRAKNRRTEFLITDN